MNISKIEAIHSLLPAAQFSTYGDQLIWDSPDIVQPTKSEIDAEVIRLQATYDAQAYARSRKAEYPPWDEQLDHIYHNGIASWKTNMVKPVKDKYPKP